MIEDHDAWLQQQKFLPLDLESCSQTSSSRTVIYLIQLWRLAVWLGGYAVFVIRVVAICQVVLGCAAISIQTIGECKCPPRWIQPWRLSVHNYCQYMRNWLSGKTVCEMTYDVSSDSEWDLALLYSASLISEMIVIISREMNTDTTWCTGGVSVILQQIKTLLIFTEMEPSDAIQCSWFIFPFTIAVVLYYIEYVTIGHKDIILLFSSKFGLYMYRWCNTLLWNSLHCSLWRI